MEKSKEPKSVHRMREENKMKHLIVCCHPNPRSLSVAYRDEVERLTLDMGNNIVVRDLYEIGFQPVLTGEDFIALQQGKVLEDVKVEQDYIRWADLVTFIYPIWWTGLPASLKGYIDRVFSHGFAYAMSKEGELTKLLAGKKVVILNNIGNPYEHYEEIGMIKSMKQTSDEGIFEFCGFEVIDHCFFGHISGSSKEEREEHIAVLGKIYDKILPDNR